MKKKELIQMSLSVEAGLALIHLLKLKPKLSRVDKNIIRILEEAIAQQNGKELKP